MIALVFWPQLGLKRENETLHDKVNKLNYIVHTANTHISLDINQVRSEF